MLALHMAVQYQNFHAALVLLKNGAYAGQRDKKGKTPLIGLIERAPELAKIALMHPKFFYENRNWTVNGT